MDYLSQSSDGAVREKDNESHKGTGPACKVGWAEEDKVAGHNAATSSSSSSSVPLASQERYFTTSSSHSNVSPPTQNSRAYDQSQYDVSYNHQHEQQQYQPHERNSGTSADVSELEDSFNGMLMAWYHTGYATGRYQTLLELSKKESIRDNPQSYQQPSHYRSHNVAAAPNRGERVREHDTHTSREFDRYSDRRNNGYADRVDNTYTNRNIGRDEDENTRQT